MVACNICDEWYHVECVRFFYPFVIAVPFFVCSNCVDTTLSGFLSHINRHAWEVINYQIKDITFICKEFSKLNVLTQKVIRFHKYPAQWKELSSKFTAPSLNILTRRGINNRHFNSYINAPIQILLGYSVAHFLPDLMSYDPEIIRELLFVKKHLSNTKNMANSFEMKNRSL